MLNAFSSVATVVAELLLSAATTGTAFTQRALLRQRTHMPDEVLFSFSSLISSLSHLKKLYAFLHTYPILVIISLNF
jgi:hypothetical protein